MYCKHCGNEISDKAIICVNCGCAARCILDCKKSKIVALLLAVFLAGFGVPRFYVGENNRGIVNLLISVLLSWTVIAPFIVWIIDVIEFATISEADFDLKYNRC